MMRYHVTSPQLTAGGAGHGAPRSAGPADVGSPPGGTASAPGPRQHVVPEWRAAHTDQQTVASTPPKTQGSSRILLSAFLFRAASARVCARPLSLGCPEPFWSVAEATALGLRGLEGGSGHSEGGSGHSEGGRPSFRSARSAG